MLHFYLDRRPVLNRFGELFKAGEDVLMLVLVDYKVAALIHLKTGNRWAKPEKIGSLEYVTDYELNLLANGSKLKPFQWHPARKDAFKLLFG